MRIIVFFFFTFYLVGCKFLEVNNNPDYRLYYKLQIRNKTGVDMEIQSYNLGRKLDKILIKNSETFEKEVLFFTNKRNVPSPNRGLFSDDLSGVRDSVIITLGNLKKITQINTLVNNKKDLFSIYLIENSINRLPRVDKSKKIECVGPYRLTFTKGDYDNATLIN